MNGDSYRNWPKKQLPSPVQFTGGGSIWLNSFIFLSIEDNLSQVSKSKHSRSIFTNYGNYGLMIYEVSVLRTTKSLFKPNLF